MQTVQRHGADKHDPQALPVMALAHNEANILPEFLRHYRAMGPVSFLIVDDGSTDATPDLLAAQPDVTVFRPVAGSSYARDKVQWRSDILDAHCAGRWCLVPDLDEHFVFAGQPGQTVAEYIAALEREGAQAVVTLMIDMYDDRPLADHVYPADAAQTLEQAFPFFDGPSAFPDGYTMRPITRARAEKFPCPPIQFAGGARDRLFYPRLDRLGSVGRRAVRKWMGMDRPINARLAPWERAIMTQVSRRYFAGRLNCPKLGLLKWQAGMRFSGGPHNVDRPLPVSESIAAFLHFTFTRGRAGIVYIAERGQHASGGAYYKRLLEGDTLDRSPVFDGTRRYDGPADLAGLIRPIPGY